MCAWRQRSDNRGIQRSTHQNTSIMPPSERVQGQNTKVKFPYDINLVDKETTDKLLQDFTGIFVFCVFLPSNQFGFKSE